MRNAADNVLMDLYAQGSQAAFEELFRRYEGRAYGYFLRRVRCEARARDLYQELFSRLHRFRDRFDPARPFEPWLFQIARNVLADEWRQRRRRAEVPLEEAELRSREADAERRVSARQELASLLAGLSPEQVGILVDAKLQGFEYAEIAERLAKSVDAVKQAASRSLRRLRLAAIPD